MLRETVRFNAIVCALVTSLGCVLHTVYAQPPEPEAIEVCKSFCTASKTQCVKDAKAGGVAGFAVAMTLGQMQWNQDRAARANSLDSLQREQKFGGNKSSLTLDAQQQCDKAQIQCKQDCAKPAESNELPSSPAKEAAP